MSRSGGSSTHCRVNLFDGRGLAVEFTRPAAPEAAGQDAPASIAGAVTVTLLPEAVLWPVMARSLPRFDELVAGPAGRVHGVAAAVAGAKATVYLDVRSRPAGGGA